MNNNNGFPLITLGELSKKLANGRYQKNMESTRNPLSRVWQGSSMIGCWILLMGAKYVFTSSLLNQPVQIGHESLKSASEVERAGLEIGRLLLVLGTFLSCLGIIAFQ